MKTILHAFAFLLLTLGAHAQTVQWKYVIPAPSISERPLALNEAHADALGGAGLVFYSLNDRGEVSGYRFVWLARNGVVKGVVEFPGDQMPSIFRISPTAVIFSFGDPITRPPGGVLRKFVIKSRKMVSSDLLLSSSESVTEGPLLTDANGFFTTATDELGTSLEIRRYRN